MAGSAWPTLARYSIVGRRSDETEVQTQQEQYEVNGGADAAALRRRHDVRAQDRHRNISKIEIKQHAGVHKEGTRQELAKVPAPPREVERTDRGDYTCNHINDDDHRPFLLLDSCHLVPKVPAG